MVKSQLPSWPHRARPLPSTYTDQCMAPLMSRGQMCSPLSSTQWLHSGHCVCMCVCMCVCVCVCIHPLCFVSLLVDIGWTFFFFKQIELAYILNTVIFCKTTPPPFQLAPPHPAASAFMQHHYLLKSTCIHTSDHRPAAGTLEFYFQAAEKSDGPSGDSPQSHPVLGIVEALDGAEEVGQRVPPSSGRSGLGGPGEPGAGTRGSSAPPRNMPRLERSRSGAGGAGRRRRASASLHRASRRSTKGYGDRNNRNTPVIHSVEKAPLHISRSSQKKWEKMCEAAAAAGRDVTTQRSGALKGGGRS